MPKPSRRAQLPRDLSNTDDRPREWAPPSQPHHHAFEHDYPLEHQMSGWRPSRFRADHHDAPMEPYPRTRRTAEAFGFEVPRQYPYAGIASEARRGRFFGRGPKGYHRSDDRILEEISDRLMTHPDIDASDLEVRVSRGVVTLTGDVEDRHEKRLAEYIAEDVLGVDDVDNRLKVRHGFWAALSGERATERELSRDAERDSGPPSREGSRRESARNAARRDSSAY